MDAFLAQVPNLLIFGLMLAILIFVHELGHFAVAKWRKVPVLEFGFGFPPRLWRFWKDHGWIEIQSRRIFIPREFRLPDNIAVGVRVLYRTEMRGTRETLTAITMVDEQHPEYAMASLVQNLDRGTEYTLNAIPLGGFVRLLGEEDPNMPGGFGAAPMRTRIAVLLAGVTMNFILAYLVFVLVAYLAPPYAPVQTTRLSAIAPNSPAALAGLRVGDSIIAVDGQNVKDNYPLLAQLLRQNAGKQVTLDVTRGGQKLDPIQVVPRVTPPAGEGPLGIGLAAWNGLRVMGVEPGSVAEKAGVRVGDILVFIVDPRGRTLRDHDELGAYTQTHPDWIIEWFIAREGQLLDPIQVRIPAQVTAQNANLGVNLRTSLLDAPRIATQQMIQIALAIPALFGQMVRGSVPANSFVGVIGIAQATTEVAERAGGLGLLQWLGLLSLNLAIVNLFPFPPLDGGQLVFVFLEWLRGGKRIDPKRQGMVHLVGAAVLVGLMIVISYFDIARLVAGQKILPP